MPIIPAILNASGYEEQIVKNIFPESENLAEQERLNKISERKTVRVREGENTINADTNS